MYVLAVYHCGSNDGWSDLFYFHTPPTRDGWQPHLAIYGDMGNENAQSLGRLQEETQRGLYDAILHVGDFAYDMDTVRYIISITNNFLMNSNCIHSSTAFLLQI